MPELYADILLPLARGVFTYRVGDLLRDVIRRGSIVEVSLGPRKRYAGVVFRLHEQRPDYSNIKMVESLIEHSPTVSSLQLDMWEWMADYYMCTTGKVMRAALPSALKPSGLSDQQIARAGYKPASDRYLKLGPAVNSAESLNEIFEQLRKRAKKQYAALIEFVEMAGDDPTQKSIPAASLTSAAPILKQLEKKGVVESFDVERQAGELPPMPASIPDLTEAQKAAADSIRSQFAQKDTVLLHGVTGSGKTEIYIALIHEQLSMGKDVLLLMPEIVMSSQLTARIRSHFGERVIAYHSAFPSRARVEAYIRASSNRGGELIMGTRSSVFLPSEKLGLVIVDEEHDTSYKSSDTAPRYHARDTARVLARMAGAKVLLGSATASLESYSNAAAGKYGLVTLTERYGSAPPTRVIVSDTLRSAKRGERRSHMNKELKDALSSTIEAGQQAILFQNRRGFAPYVECDQCGWTPRCPHCNVTLTLHKAEQRLKCHYCGFASAMPSLCPECGGAKPSARGFGTEKVEQEIAALFPDARVARLDRDTAGTPTAYNRIIDDFAKGHIDVLVGTQMVTKGFDFGGVSLIGILNADNLLNYPDFRASERAFQVMTQVAGRAGRRQDQAVVVIQTAQPANAIIAQVAQGDYCGMAREQLAEREAFFYPPYCRMITVTMAHTDLQLVEQAAMEFARLAAKVFGRRITGPQPPVIDKLKDLHMLMFTVKIERGRSFSKAKAILSGIAAKISEQKRLRPVRIIFDVDPQ